MYQEFALCNFSQPLQTSPNIFSDYYEVNPADLSVLSSECMGSLSSRAVEKNPFLYQPVLSSLFCVIDGYIKRQCLYEMMWHRRASEEEIMVMATGLVKLRYLVERKVRLINQKTLFALKEKNKQKKKVNTGVIGAGNKVQRMAECVDAVYNKYYRREMMGEALKEIMRLVSDPRAQALANLSALTQEIRSRGLKEGMSNVKEHCKRYSQVDILVGAIDYTTHLFKRKFLEECWQWIQQQQKPSAEESEIGPDISHLTEEFRQVLVQNQQQGSINVENFDKSIFTPASSVNGDIQEQFTQVGTQRPIEVTVYQPQQHIIHTPKQHIDSSHCKTTGEKVNLPTEDQEALMLTPTSPRQQSTKGSQKQLKEFLSTSNQPFKASKMSELQCKQISQEYFVDESMVVGTLKKEDSEGSVESRKRQTVASLKEEPNRFKKNNNNNNNLIDIEASRAQTTHQALRGKLKFHPASVAGSLGPVALEMTPAKVVQGECGCCWSESVDTMAERPFESLFFAKNHRSNNLYHLHPDIAYQPLGDINDTPMIFTGRSSSIFRARNASKEKLTAPQRLASVRSAQNLLSLQKMEKSIIFGVFDPLFASTTKYEKRHSETNKEYDLMGTKSTGIPKLKRFSSGSEAFEEYLREKQTTKKGSNYFSSSDNLKSPMAFQSSSPFMKSQPFQVADYFPLVSHKYRQESEMPVSPPVSLASPFNLNYRSHAYK